MLQVNNISFCYKKGSNILNNISFTLAQGETLCVMGESGGGKSTLLKIIYGLLDTNNGAIFWNNQPILGPAYHLVPGIDFFKYVAQDFDLMPYTTVAENINKFLSRFYPAESKKRVNELLEVIEMTDFANEKVKNLSGGQQQRVAIARALAKEPELLLLDEPFSQIDNFKKNTLRRNLFDYLKKQKIACIIATHDTNDALSFADKLIVIKDNEIIANETPSDLYKNPKEKYIASLFDDVNDITIHFNKKDYNFLIFPHQIINVKKSIFKAKILTSFYKGNYWLIKATFNEQIIYFNNFKSIEKEKEIFINFCCTVN